MPAAQDHLKQLLADHIAPLLQSRGYKRQGKTWNKRTPIGWLIYNIQSSRHSTSDAVDFTINLGAFSEQLEALFTPVLPRAPVPAERDCQYRERIGAILPDRRDHWWRLGQWDDPAALGAELRTITQDIALPHLEQAATHEGLLRIIETSPDPHVLVHAALILLLRGPDASRNWLHARTDVSDAHKQQWFNRLDEVTGRRPDQ